MVLLMLYVITVSGFALNLHYCFNELSSVKVDAPANACTRVLESSKMKCCKDKHIEIKVKDVHQNNSPLHWSKFFPVAALPLSLFVDFIPATPNPLRSTLAERGPPQSPDIPVFLKNCTFRI